MPSLTDETNPPFVQSDRWLAALEQELKFRIGWVDEAVSPFAARREVAPATAPGKISHRPIQTGKAA
jgi:hypothetical protein